ISLPRRAVPGFWNRLNRAISSRPITTQIARFRKFEFIGVPSCAGPVVPPLPWALAQLIALARRRPAWPMLLCNIGVYRIFAKFEAESSLFRQPAANAQQNAPNSPDWPL